jgi:late competence protein required for DNA uptake (superfamily II DNA/RNA helicase)
MRSLRGTGLASGFVGKYPEDALCVDVAGRVGRANRRPASLVFRRK